MTTAQVDAGGKKKTKGGGRKNALAGFYVDKVDGAAMRAYVKQNKLNDVDVDVEDEQLAVSLVTHFKETTPAESLVRCENCEAVSHEDEERCPICGDEGEVEETALAEAESSPSLVEAPDDEDGEEVANEDDEEGEEGEEDPEDVSVAEESAEKPEAATPSRAAKAKKERAKMADTQTANGAVSPKKSAALAKRGAADGKLTAKDLDKAIAEVQRLLANSHVSYYEFSKEIFRISDEQLWKLRKKEDGSARYTSWEAFVHHELKMSPAHSYNAIECAKNYKSAKEIQDVGGKSKAVLLLKAAPADRKRLKAKARAGASKRELEKDVAESRKKHGPTKTSQQAQAGAKGKASQEAKKAKTAEKITIANIEGSKSLKMYAKPESMKGLVWPPEKRAVKIADLPFCRLELQPGVVQYISVLIKDGALVCNVQTRREEG